jgi:hypothetical protein
MGGLEHGQEVEVTWDLLQRVFAAGFDCILTHNFIVRSKREGGDQETTPRLMIDFGGKRMKQR